MNTPLGSVHVVVYADGKRAIETHDGVVVAKEVSEEFAHLFAAAGPMRTALERSLGWLSRYPGEGAFSACEQAREALAQALK